MKYYATWTTIQEDMPDYDLIIKAKTESEAFKIAREIATEDYGEHIGKTKTREITSLDDILV